VSRVHERIDDDLRSWIESQPLFFVGSAPLDSTGHVNVSPKGPVGGLRVLGERRVAYLDVVGSGAETIAHIRENGRIVVMLCSFSESPRIVRLHGQGRVLSPDEGEFTELRDTWGLDADEVERAIVVIDVSRIAESPGDGVPIMDYRRDRTEAGEWAEKKVGTRSGDEVADFQREENAESIDGLPSVDWIESD
jgi:Pyridoxamine 5'-phosphate oxidase